MLYPGIQIKIDCFGSTSTELDSTEYHFRQVTVDLLEAVEMFLSRGNSESRHSHDCSRDVIASNGYDPL